MRVLILGASGFIGRHLWSALVDQQINVVGTQSRSVRPAFIPFELGRDRILDRVPVPFFDEPGLTHVVYCTGFGSPDQCARQVEASRNVNVAAIRRMVEDLSSLRVRHVYLSSSYVFDGQTGGYRESDPCHAICEYGRQKVEVEAFLRTTSPESLILRLDKVVGDDPTERHLFSEWNDLLQQSRPIRCLPGQTMSPIFVDDVARLIIDACRSGLSGLYHASGAETIERIALARQFQQAMSLAGTIVEANPESFHFADARPLHSDLDGQALREVTGFRPTPLRQIMSQFRGRLT